MNKEKEKAENHLSKKEEVDKEQDVPRALQEEELKKKKDEYDVLWHKYIRVCADFDNARKRWEREKEDIVKFANSSLLRELIIILDETEQALKMVKEHSNIEEIVKGLEMTYSNFISILNKRGLKTIDVTGKEFNPHLHEIVASREVEEDIDNPIVLEEIQKGYLLEDKVLRPAKVIVGIKKKTEGESEVRNETQNENDGIE